MKVALIADPDTAIGFKLAGLKETYTAEDFTQARTVFSKLIKAPDIGVIIITESLASGIRLYIKEYYKEIIPVIVEIPDKMGPSSSIEFIRELIRRTIGVEIIME
ncbi:MAG: V-type ATP synthase subunit F [Candidatus Methanomethylicia archaeon]